MYEQKLLEAVYSGDVNLVHFYLDIGADVYNTVDILGNSFLSLALTRRHREVTKLLIEKGLDVNVEDAIGHAPLQGAAMEGWMDVAEMLISRGANVNVSDKKYRTTPLMLAAQCGHLETVKLLISKGADLNATDTYGRTAMHYAIMGSNYRPADDPDQVEVVDVLIKHGANVNAKATLGNDCQECEDATPLYAAENLFMRPHVAELIRRNGGTK